MTQLELDFGEEFAPQGKTDTSDDEIVEMAKQCGIMYREMSDEFHTGYSDGVEMEQMKAFADLVAAKEREINVKKFTPVLAYALRVADLKIAEGNDDTRS